MCSHGENLSSISLLCIKNKINELGYQEVDISNEMESVTEGCHSNFFYGEK